MENYRLTKYRLSAMSNIIPSIKDRLSTLKFATSLNYDFISTEDKDKDRIEYINLSVSVAVLSTYFHRDSLQQYKVWSNEFSIPREDFIVGLKSAKILVDSWYNNKSCVVSDYAKALYKKYYSLIKSLVQYRMKWDRGLKESDIYG